jgi:hypothetical protein
MEKKKRESIIGGFLSVNLILFTSCWGSKAFSLLELESSS